MSRLTCFSSKARSPSDMALRTLISLLTKALYLYCAISNTDGVGIALLKGLSLFQWRAVYFLVPVGAG